MANSSTGTDLEVFYAGGQPQTGVLLIFSKQRIRYTSLGTESLHIRIWLHLSGQITF